VQVEQRILAEGNRLHPQEGSILLVAADTSEQVAEKQFSAVSLIIRPNGIPEGSNFDQEEVLRNGTSLLACRSSNIPLKIDTQETRSCRELFGTSKSSNSRPGAKSRIGFSTT
jgi:hypothetical protein